MVQEKRLTTGRLPIWIVYGYALESQVWRRILQNESRGIRRKPNTEYGPNLKYTHVPLWSCGHDLLLSEEGINHFGYTYYSEV